MHSSSASGMTRASGGSGLPAASDAWLSGQSRAGERTSARARAARPVVAGLRVSLQADAVGFIAPGFAPGIPAAIGSSLPVAHLEHELE